MAIAFAPIGVEPPGVSKGVARPGVVIECGVILGVIVALPPIEGVAADGVSSHRDLRFDAPGVESMIDSPAPLSARGVSIQPEL